jgi:hypothetical protein
MPKQYALIKTSIRNKYFRLYIQINRKFKSTKQWDHFIEDLNQHIEWSLKNTMDRIFVWISIDIGNNDRYIAEERLLELSQENVRYNRFNFSRFKIELL